VVCHLYNPGAGRTLSAVKDAALPLNEDEQILNEIFCLRGIPQDSGGNAAENSLVSSEEKAKSFVIAVEKANQQVFVREGAIQWARVSAFDFKLLVQRKS
jgi:hypothetical protein